MGEGLSVDGRFPGSWMESERFWKVSCPHAFKRWGSGRRSGPLWRGSEAITIILYLTYYVIPTFKFRLKGATQY